MSKTEKFIEKAQKLHGELYDYSITIYQRSDEKVQVICKQHGVFSQRASMHLSGQGCKKCAVDKRANSWTTTDDMFIKKAEDVHGNKYVYSNINYVNSKTKVEIVCKQHGSFLQRPDIHLAGSGCTKCANEVKEGVPPKTQEHFIEKATKIHKNKYSYEKTVYKKSTEKITIICPIHGDFLQTANVHYRGIGCTKCSSYTKGGYSRTDYVRRVKGKICTFYTIKCFNEDEEFYKIGITVKTVQERYLNTNTMPYNYEIISEIQGEAGFIWDMELAEKRKLRRFNYQPTLKFAGSKTECFTQYIINEAN